MTRREPRDPSPTKTSGGLTEKALCCISSIILIAPLTIFAVGWLRPLPAIAWFLALMAALFAARGLGCRRCVEDAPIRWWKVVLILVVAAAWTALSGAGGIGHQNFDWAKHNAVLRDLIARPWPVWFAAEEVARADMPPAPRPLVYYIAFYLPASLVGRLLGWWPANIALHLQTVFTVACALAWFHLMAGRRHVLACSAIFIVLSGADAVGFLLFVQVPRVWEGQHIEWWTTMQYPSTTAALFWAPQHAIPAWLGAGLIWHGERTGRWSVAVFAVVAAILWSPFAAVGLAPFAAWTTLRTARPSAHAIAFLIFAAVIAAPFAVYILGYSEFTNGPSGSYLFRPRGFAASMALEWGIAATFGFYIAYRYAVALPARFWIACALLFVIPLFPLPGGFDYIMRTSMPALFVLGAVLTGLALNVTRGPLRIVWAVLLLAGSPTAVGELVRAAEHLQIGHNTWLSQDTVSELEPSAIARQYLGRPDSWLWTVLLRPKP